MNEYPKEDLIEYISLKEAVLLICRKTLPLVGILFLCLGVAAGITILIREGIMEGGILPMGISALMVFPAAYSMLVITIYSNVMSDMLANWEEDRIPVSKVKACVNEHTKEVLGKGWNLFD